MNAETLQRRLAEIAEMDTLDHEPELRKVRDDCKADYPQTLAALRAALKTLVKGRDEEETDEVIEAVENSLNDEFFVIELSGKIRIGHWDDGALNLMTRADFLTKVENRLFAGPNGLIPAGPQWLQSARRREYSRVAMIPTGDVPSGTLNTWRGWGVEPKHGDCQIILDHIHEILCGGDDAVYEYTLNWIAAKVQNPNRVMGVMLVFQSGQGTGKGLIADELMCRMFGNQAMTIDNADQLLGRFNKHLLNICYLCADEAFFAGDRKAAQRLKRTVTGKTVMIQPKGIDTFSAASHLGIMACTNMNHAVQIDADDRRVLVCRTSSARKGDRKYFKTLADHIHGDGAAHFLQKMLDRDVSEWSPEHDRPVTMATIEQREMSLHSVHRWWAEQVEEGRIRLQIYGHVEHIDDWETQKLRVSRSEIRDAFTHWARATAGENYDIPGPKRFWNLLREVSAFEFDDRVHNNRQVVFDILSSQINALRRFVGDI